MDICALCQQPTVTGHTLSLDNDRRIWRICCLCAAELVGRLDRADVPQP